MTFALPLILLIQMIFSIRERSIPIIIATLFTICLLVGYYVKVEDIVYALETPSGGVLIISI